LRSRNSAIFITGAASLMRAGDRIRSFIERIEHIEEEIKALNEAKKEIYLEAKDSM
jgi:uncharacterized protein (UPF0335 family)